MSMKVKGLLKGLRYISHIFVINVEEEKQEQELQIGNPTDVKHVAHIGWDGPTQNPPTWINQFKDEGASTPTPSNGDEQNGSKARDSKQRIQGKRESNGSESTSLESPSRRRSGKSKTKTTKQPLTPMSQSVDSSKKSSSEQNRTRLSGDSEPHTGDSSATKPSRRKKSKATSAKSKSTNQPPDNLTNSRTRGHQNGLALDS